MISIAGSVAGMCLIKISAWLPLHLYQCWDSDAREILGLPSDLSPDNYSAPHTSLSRRLCVPIVCGVLSAGISMTLGITLEGATFILLTFALITLGLIDADHKILPDIIVLPLLWAGLIANNFDLYVTDSDSLWGAIGGYMALWTIFWVFKLITGKEGMGHGDFKLLAAIGAWGGWQIVSITMVIAVLLGALFFALKRLYSSEHNPTSELLPFGPFIAAAGWGCILFTLLEGTISF